MNLNRFACAYSTQADWQEAVRDCLCQLALPPGANLGFVYASDRFASHFGALCAGLGRETGVAHWVGSVGVGVIAPGRELLDTPALAVMVAALPEGSFRVLPTLASLEDVLRHESDFRLNGAPAHFGIVHGDPRNALIGELIEHVAARTETGFLAGGLTSSRFQNAQVADQPTQGGLSGVLFSAAVPVVSRLTQGVWPLGPVRKITQAERNIVIRIDGRPALDVLFEDIGEVLARNLQRAAHSIFAGLPVPGSDTGDYLVRHLVGADTESRLIAIGEFVEPGQAIMFCRRDGASAVDDMRRMLDALEEALPAPAQGALYFSCLGRGASMFGRTSVEIEMIRAALGDVPLVGFYANGEISRNQLYGYTGVLTVFT